MNCQKCGTKNPEAANHCLHCGTKLMSLNEADTFGGISMPPLPPSDSPAVPPLPKAPALPSGLNSMVTAGPWVGGAAAPAMAPDTVDFGPRYRIERMLGQGGMGAVYKAYDKELDRPVALKLIRPDLAAEPQALARFKQELLLASKVSHKNILRIHDLGEANGVKFISMAYVQGQDLHQLLQRGRLTLDEALAFARQLCAALDAAHAEGVVHRDLKPQNVLLDENRTVYVTDFGLAKSLESDTSMTMTGQFIGTPRYMAPEQVEGTKIDHRTDLYAFGLMLYEMCTGDVPFHAESAIRLMYMRVNEAPKSPLEFNPDLPPWLAQVIMKAIDRDPERRYQSAKEMLADLDAGSAPAAMPAPPAPAAGHDSRQISFNVPVLGKGKKLLAGLGAAVVLVLALLAVPGVRHRLFPSAGTAQTAAAGPKHVAILPVKVLGDPKAIGYIGEGVEEALFGKLTQLHAVSVASEADVAKIKPDQPLAEIAKTLGVTLVVQGTLQGEGDKVRLVFTLDDASAGARLWTQEFSGMRQDLLTLEDQVYAGLVKALAVNTTSEELARSSAHPTENVGAYELYLKGRNAFTRGELNRQNLDEALKLFQQATAQDSNFALAYSGMSDVYLRMYRETKDPAIAAKAVSAAEQALRLNSALPEVHGALGAAYVGTGKLNEGIAELNEAIKLAPNSDEGYRKLGVALRAAGHKDEAIQAYRKAIDVNPYYWLNYDAYGTALARLGENEQALATYKKAIELDPGNPVPYRNMGVVYFQQNKFDECIPWFQKSLTLQQHFATYSNLGTAYFYLKRYAEAVQMFEKAVAMNPNQETVMGNLADAYRWAGKLPQAADAYNKAIGLALKELQVNPRSAGTLGSLALYYAKKGDRAQAAQFMRRARTIDPKDVNQIYNQAVVETLGGENIKALASLRQAFEKGYPAREAASDPELSTLQSNPLFVTLVQQFQGK